MRQVRVVLPFLSELTTAETQLHSPGHSYILKPGFILFSLKLL